MDSLGAGKPCLGSRDLQTWEKQIRNKNVAQNSARHRVGAQSILVEWMRNKKTLEIRDSEKEGTWTIRCQKSRREIWMAQIQILSRPHPILPHHVCPHGVLKAVLSDLKKLRPSLPALNMEWNGGGWREDSLSPGWHKLMEAFPVRAYNDSDLGTTPILWPYPEEPWSCNHSGNNY